MVFPSTLLKQSEEENPYAFAFSIPNNTPGLKFICRESFDYGKSHFDHPLVQDLRKWIRLSFLMM